MNLFSVQIKAIDRFFKKKRDTKQEKDKKPDPSFQAFVQHTLNQDNRRIRRE